jgi:D-alanyl-D-alanine carboxypeptidase
MKPHKIGFTNWLQVLLALVLALGLLPAQVRLEGHATKAPGNGDLAAAIDAVMSKAYKPDQPGAAVIAVKDGKVVFRKGYGMANLELGVEVKPDMVFRLGSITKQFTAVAILMLAEQGKLSLSDDITKYLPDFPTQGHKITIEHLLTHTSGIKNYTALPEWLPLWRKDMSLTDLIGIFKDKPLDFAPGEKWSYSNSGYILLGAIIEKASGETYQDFIEKKIFAQVGMKHSFYDRTYRLIPGRVEGYSKQGEDFINCAYLSMTQPYAAGSLASSVDDLALWDQALYTEKLVKQESLQRAWTTFHLNNGKPTNYGYGWGVSSLEDHRLIFHNGGINGFATSAMRLPEIQGYVAILTNSDSDGPDENAAKVALLLLGKPYKEPTPVDLPTAAIDRYVGTYQRQGGPSLAVTREGNKLFVLFPRKVEIVPISETEFLLKGSMNHVFFTRDASGMVTEFRLRTLMGPEMTGTKSNK